MKLEIPSQRTLSGFMVPLIVLNLALITAIPWVFGGNHPYVRVVCLAVFTVQILFTIAHQAFLRKSEESNRFVPWVPLFLFVLLGIGLIAAAGQVLPGTPEFLESRLGISNIGDINSRSETISIYPAATRERLCSLILGIAAFAFGFLAFRQRNHVFWFFSVILVNGVLLAFIGMLQRVSWNGKIFWTFKIERGAPFSAFVNSNNAGGFLLICFGAAFFFLVHLFHSNSSSPFSDEKQSGSFWERIGNFALVRLADLKVEFLYLFAGAILIVAGIIASYSRSSIGALFIATCVGTLFLGRFRKLAIVAMILAIGAAAVFVFQYDGSERLNATLESMTNLSEASESRVAHWKNGLDCAENYSAVGAGLGTYSFAYMHYQTDREFSAWFRYAENIYLETFVEFGWIGIALLGGVILLALGSCLRLLLSKESLYSAMGIAGLVMLIGQACIAFFDFGIYQPANSVYFGIAMGIIVFHSSQVGVSSDQKSRLHAIFGGVCLLIVFGIACAGAWATYESFGVDLRKAAAKRIANFDESRNSASFRLRKAIRELETSIRIRPDDAESHFLLGQAHVLEYRLAISKAIMQKPDAKIEKIDDVWPLTDMASLHRTVVELRRQKQPVEVITNNEHFENHIVPAFEHYQLAEKHGGLLPTALFRVLQFQPLFEKEEPSRESVKESINRALARCPSSPKNLFSLGLLAHNEQLDEIAVQCWKKCLEYNDDYEEFIVEICRRELPMSEFFGKVLPNDPVVRIQMAKKYFGKPNEALLRKLLLRHTGKSVEESTELDSGEKAFLLAEIAFLCGNSDEAAKKYFASVEANPQNVMARIGYARSLIKLKNYDEAFKQLRYCQIYFPKSNRKTVSELLRDLKFARKSESSN